MFRAALPALLLPAWVAAQDAQAPQPSPAPSHEEYVEVTATRIPEEASEVPASIDVITGEELRERGATDLRSALALAAGIDVAPGGDGGPASSVPEFWGLKEFDAFLLVVDGVPWGGAFNPALATLDLSDVERIEVLRGAAPVMYGATSFVGVIHVIHRSAAESRGNVTLTGGSYASGAARAGASLPIWAGFRSSLNVDLGRQGFKDDRAEYQRGHLLWRNSRAIGRGLLRFDADGTWLDQDPASPHPRKGPALSPLVPLDANHNPRGAFLDERRLAVSAGYDRPLGKSQWSTTASFTRSRQNVFRGFLTDVTAEAPNARGFRERIDVTDVYLDTHLEWTGSARVKVVAGLDHLHGEGEAKGAVFDYLVNLDGSSPSVGADFSPPLDIAIGDRRELSGLYGFLEWNPTVAWRLEAGARLNRAFESREGEEGEAGRGEKGTGEERTDLRASGSIGLSYTPWRREGEHVRLFANYRNTFKPAAVDFGIGEGEEGEGERELLKAETAESYELGVKTRVWRGRVTAQVAAFLMDFTNLVVAQSIGGLPARVNAGSERFRGLEASIAWRLPQHVSWRGAYSLHDARFRDFLTAFDGVPTQLRDKRLEMSARHLASTSFSYAPERGLSALAELSRVGSRYLNKRNTALASPYATLSAALGYRWGQWELRASGRNLNDRRDAVAESELGDAQYYRLPARSVEVSLTRRF